MHVQPGKRFPACKCVRLLPCAQWLTLCGLLHTQVEAEEDMRCSRTGRQQQHAQQVLGLKAHIRHMEAAVRQAQQEQAAARSL